MKPLPLHHPGPRPVLMILTHPFRGVKNLLITLRCLERYTDLRAFKKIYILANCTFGEHELLIQKYVKKYPGLIQDVHCSPAGHNPCVAHMQNLVHEQHFKDVILKMDDDMFVTPGWLPPMLEAYKKFQHDPKCGLIAPVVPINTMGAKMLMDIMIKLYGDHYKEIWVRYPEIGNNLAYHHFVWHQVLHDELIEKYLKTVDAPYHVATGEGSHTSINCVIYDERVMEKIYPYNLEEEWFEDGEKKFDESIINRLARKNELFNVVACRSIVHHYAFNRCQDDLAQLIPFEDVYQYVSTLLTKSKAIRHLATNNVLSQK